MSEIDTIKKKIVLLGDGAVGKTSLIRRFVINKFDDKYLCTLGTKVTEKNLLVKIEDDITLGLKLMIWDFMGQKGFRKIEKSGLDGTTGALLVYDITRAETLASLEEYWLPLLYDAASEVPVLFLANKIDLLSSIRKDSPEVTSMDDFQKIAHKYKATGFFTSALSGKNVENAFGSLGKLLIKNHQGQEQPKGELQLPNRILHHVNGKYESAIIRVTDEIIMDFHKNFGGDLEETMPIIRKQFEKAGVDINEPTVAGLRRAVDYLRMVESNFWSDEEINNRRQRRLSIINQLDEPDGVEEPRRL